MHQVPASLFAKALNSFPLIPVCWMGVGGLLPELSSPVGISIFSHTTCKCRSDYKTGFKCLRVQIQIRANITFIKM
jgi:hypothetical protein